MLELHNATNFELRAEVERLRKQVAELQADMTRLVNERRADDLHCQVYAFHRAFNQPTCSVPKVPPLERVKLRLALITEEYLEVIGSVLRINPALCRAFKEEVKVRYPSVDLPHFVKELADLDFVVEGTRIEFGVDGKPIARMVAKNNLDKVRNATLSPEGKIVKAANHPPPPIHKELRRQGWR